jgi:hypothetical protein
MPNRYAILLLFLFHIMPSQAQKHSDSVLQAIVNQQDFSAVGIMSYHVQGGKLVMDEFATAAFTFLFLP